MSGRPTTRAAAAAAARKPTTQSVPTSIPRGAGGGGARSQSRAAPPHPPQTNGGRKTRAVAGTATAAAPPEPPSKQSSRVGRGASKPPALRLAAVASAAANGPPPPPSLSPRFSGRRVSISSTTSRMSEAPAGKVLRGKSKSAKSVAGEPVLSEAGGNAAAAPQHTAADVERQPIEGAVIHSEVAAQSIAAPASTGTVTGASAASATAHPTSAAGPRLSVLAQPKHRAERPATASSVRIGNDSCAGGRAGTAAAAAAAAAALGTVSGGGVRRASVVSVTSLSGSRLSLGAGAPVTVGMSSSMRVMTVPVAAANSRESGRLSLSHLGASAAGPANSVDKAAMTQRAAAYRQMTAAVAGRASNAAATRMRRSSVTSVGVSTAAGSGRRTSLSSSSSSFSSSLVQPKLSASAAGRRMSSTSLYGVSGDGCVAASTHGGGAGGDSHRRVILVMGGDGGPEQAFLADDDMVASALAAQQLLHKQLVQLLEAAVQEADANVALGCIDDARRVYTNLLADTPAVAGKALFWLQRSRLEQQAGNSVGAMTLLAEGVTACRGVPYEHDLVCKGITGLAQVSLTAPAAAASVAAATSGIVATVAALLSAAVPPEVSVNASIPANQGVITSSNAAVMVEDAVAAALASTAPAAVTDQPETMAVPLPGTSPTRSPISSVLGGNPRPGLSANHLIPAAGYESGNGMASSPSSSALAAAPSSTVAVGMASQSSLSPLTAASRTPLPGPTSATTTDRRSAGSSSNNGHSGGSRSRTGPTRSLRFVRRSTGTPTAYSAAGDATASAAGAQLSTAASPQPQRVVVVVPTPVTATPSSADMGTGALGTPPNRSSAGGNAHKNAAATATGRRQILATASKQYLLPDTPPTARRMLTTAKKQRVAAIAASPPGGNGIKPPTMRTLQHAVSSSPPIGGGNVSPAQMPADVPVSAYAPVSDYYYTILPPGAEAADNMGENHPVVSVSFPAAGKSASVLSPAAAATAASSSGNKHTTAAFSGGRRYRAALASPPLRVPVAAAVTTTTPSLHAHTPSDTPGATPTDVQMGSVVVLQAVAARPSTAQAMGAPAFLTPVRRSVRVVRKSIAGIILAKAAEAAAAAAMQLNGGKEEREEDETAAGNSSKVHTSAQREGITPAETGVGVTPPAPHHTDAGMHTPPADVTGIVVPHTASRVGTARRVAVDAGVAMTPHATARMVAGSARKVGPQRLLVAPTTAGKSAVTAASRAQAAASGRLSMGLPADGAAVAALLNSTRRRHAWKSGMRVVGDQGVEHGTEETSGVSAAAEPVSATDVLSLCLGPTALASALGVRTPSTRSVTTTDSTLVAGEEDGMDGEGAVLPITMRTPATKLVVSEAGKEVAAGAALSSLPPPAAAAVAAMLGAAAVAPVPAHTLEDTGYAWRGNPALPGVDLAHGHAYAVVGSHGDHGHGHDNEGSSTGIEVAQAAAAAIAATLYAPATPAAGMSSRTRSRSRRARPVDELEAGNEKGAEVDAAPVGLALEPQSTLFAPVIR